MATELEMLHDLDSERRMLACMMSASAGDPLSARRAVDSCGLTADHFFLPAHREVYSEARALLAKGQPVDSVSLWAKLACSAICKEQGGIGWLSEIECEFGSVAAIPAVSERIAELHLRRSMFSQAEKLRTDALNHKLPATEALAAASKRIAGMTTASGRTLRTLTDVMHDCITQMQETQLGKPPKRVSTGMRYLDWTLGGGLPPGELTIIGAEPGTGKSAVLASILNGAAKSGSKIGIFSLEDDAHWIGWRLWAFESDVPQGVLKAKPLTDFQKKRAVEGIDRLGLISEGVIIDDRCGLTTTEICSTATDMILNHGCQAIIIDHLGEVKHDGKAERFDLAIGQTLSDIRTIAKRYMVPIVVASQLNRRKDRQPGEIPIKSDFRNSGDIEAIARVMIGLAREPKSDTLLMGILKHTNGKPNVIVKANFVGLAAMVRECEHQDDDEFEKEGR